MCCFNKINLSAILLVHKRIMCFVCWYVWSVLQFQTYVLRKFGVFPCSSAVWLPFSMASEVGSTNILMCPVSSLIFPVGVECGMPSSERVSYSPYCRWETVGFGVVCGNGPHVRVSTGWPPAAGGPRSGTVGGWP